MSFFEPSLGANVVGHSTRFRVWAPDAARAEVLLETPDHESVSHDMARVDGGFHELLLPGAGAGDLYRYRIDGRGPYPDPASRSQPLGVHGPSQVVDWRQFPWTDAGWRGLDLADTVFYELHVGTFTPEGSFAAAAAHLPELRALGVTAVELMPVADFPGSRNWGYDGVAPFAPARCYGGPDDLRAFVDEAHGLGLAVHLDVVYNHLGPDGAYQFLFSRHYYSTAHRSPWGAGINFDGPLSEPVRDYFIENALRWIHEYHVDGLRLDATNEIVDDSPRHILASIAAAVHASMKGHERRGHVLAEDERNLAFVLQSEPEGGLELDGVWSDDFHHQVRRTLAGDTDGYFQAFAGGAGAIAATARQGWFYTGQDAAYYGGSRGSDPAGIAKPRFVFFLQNHDQVGNRAFGDRLHHSIDPAAWRAASTLLLLLPETPLLFMGQEWAASAPFQYFTDHHPELGRLVSAGRREEFRRFTAFSEPASISSIPDPQSERTFLDSRLDWAERDLEPHACCLRLYRSLLLMRRTEPALHWTADAEFSTDALDEDVLLLRRARPDSSTLLAVIRLSGTGPSILQAASGFELAWTTEDPPFVTNPKPVAWDAQRSLMSFLRPGAAILRKASAP